jgi:hypothetical protein
VSLEWEGLPVWYAPRDVETSIAMQAAVPCLPELRSPEIYFPVNIRLTAAKLSLANIGRSALIGIGVQWKRT